MIRFCNLYSGSSGNSTYIEYNDTRILIDAGVSCQKIVKGLSDLNVSLDMIDGILITHEHSDHVKGLTTISKKFNIPIYATNKTWNQMALLKLPEYNHIVFNANESFDLGELKVHPFSIPHDAVDPCAFNITAGNKKLTVATDIGHVTKGIYDKLVGSDVLLLESNYDPNTLSYSSYPYFLKRRISSDVGHLSNEMASKVIKKLYDDTGINHIILGHLSKENNFPELAYQTVVNAFGEIPKDFHLSVAGRDTVDTVLVI
ncbi:MAG: MBL fold metallo-hydrolase [Clostridia bacterium]|nr:MBL fold metallo-hydrolase [Clostridia bacterium]